VASVVRRDNSEKHSLSLDDLGARATQLLETMQKEMFDAALKFRDDATHDVATVSQAREAAQEGFARLPWAVVDGEGEVTLKNDAITVRCLQRADGSMPDSDTEKDLVCIVAKSY
jgi:prolyl-tRNA synthetase